MFLYIIRHAWAGHFGDPAWLDDFQRPLTEEGRQRFARMVEILVDRGFRPGVVATSPLVRCRETAEIIAQLVPDRPEVIDCEDLMPGRGKKDLLNWTSGQAEQFDEIAWVGHAPDVGRLVATLVGESGGWVRFAKGAVAALRFDDKVEPGGGELRWLATAKLLGC